MSGDGARGHGLGLTQAISAAIERLTRRRVVAFLSANQTTPGVACELFFLKAAPLAVIASRRPA